MIDNFEQIKGLLVFDNEDQFYHLQIIKRKKDNPGTAGRNNNARCMKTYYIISKEYLEEKKEEIILLCKIHNARACLNLNRRSFEKIAFQTLIKITGQIMSKDFKSVRRAYDSVCGAHSHDSHTKWLIDVDDKSIDPDHILMRLALCQPVGNKLIANIPTKNGYHLIVKPFNVTQYIGDIPLDIHKNNPTILMIP